MKKTYEKPQIYMERFELAEHIAGCYLQMNLADAGVCNASGEISGRPVKNIFLENSIDNVCTVDGESFCYTNGSFNIATINS